MDLLVFLSRRLSRKLLLRPTAETDTQPQQQREEGSSSDSLQRQTHNHNNSNGKVWMGRMGQIDCVGSVLEALV